MASPPLESWCRLWAAQCPVSTGGWGSLLTCWGRAASELALFFPAQLTVVSKQILASHLLIFPCLALGSFYLAAFFSVYTEASCTLPPTVLIITSPEAHTVISYLIHCLLFQPSASFTFTLALSLSTQAVSPHVPRRLNPFPAYINRTSPFSACYLPLSLEAHPLYY